MAKRPAIEQYHAKIEEARAIAQGAAADLRSRAKELIGELESIRAAYEELMGEPLPEFGGPAPAKRRGRPAGRGTKRTGSRGGKGSRGRRTQLKGSYAGKTIPEAVVAALGKSKSGLGPTEIAEKIGGNRSSVAVALSGMVKEGLIKRAERGTYVAG